MDLSKTFRLQVHDVQKVGWLFLFLLVGACSTTKSTPSASPSVVTIVTSPTQYNQTFTATATDTPLSTRTPSLTPTKTSKATGRLFSSKTPSPTVIIYPTPTIPQETLDARQTMEPFVPICDSSWLSELSPDGEWIAGYPCLGGGENVPFYLKVLNIHSHTEWQVDFDSEKYGYYDGFIWPSHWTKDGHFLYVALIKQMDGSTMFISATILLRLDLTTGEVKEIFADGFHRFAFSLSDKLAYVSRHGITILDTISWKEQVYSIDLEYCQIGDILWSPTEEQIIFQTWKCKEGGYDEYLSYNLNLLNLNDGTYKEIYTSVEQIPPSFPWKGKYPIYGTPGSSWEKGECFELNLDNGEWLSTECP